MLRKNRATIEVLEGRLLLSAATTYLQNTDNQFTSTTALYTDGGAAGNHFLYPALISSSGSGDSSAVSMNEYWSGQGSASGALPESGRTAIECQFNSLADSNWGGFIFENGILPAGSTSPTYNFGTVPDAGLDLTGATQLTFWARGEAGGEQVQFFALGVGRDSGTGAPTSPYPDSSPKISTPVITLTTTWTQYSLNLAGLDLSYVLGGFGWVATSQSNPNIQFYLDNIQYNVAPPASQPHLLVSFQTQNGGEAFDEVMESTAYTYDNDLALMSLLQSGDTTDAMQIANSLVYASQDDPYYSDSRIRNAYTGGDLVNPPGWTPNGKVAAVRTAGWYDESSQTFEQDPSQLGTSTGTMAWTILALGDAYQATNNSAYLSTAEELGTWVSKNCHTSGNGYTAGTIGPDPATKLRYKSTEQNIDMYAADRLLYTLTHVKAWNSRATIASNFVMSMLNKPKKGLDFFWGGTNANGKGIDKGVIPLDVQALAVMAFGVKKKAITSGLNFADSNIASGSGYAFSNADTSGVWTDGTAMMAIAKALVGDAGTSQALVDYLHTLQSPDGGLVEATKDNLATGYDASEGQPFNLYDREAVSSTSWLAFAELGFNPLTV